MDRGDCEDIPAKVMWRPQWAKATLMTQFRERINARFNLALTNYHQLYKWSCENYSLFWQEYFKFSGVVYSTPALGVIDSDASIASIPKWFPGLRLNYAENLLAHCDDRVALYGASEGKDSISSYTFKEMRHHVSRYAASMIRMGIQMGDRVAGYLPNCPEAIFAMLATASIGAIWSSTSPDFGADGVLSRFQQIGPKLLFSVNGVVYNGKTHNHLGKVNSVLKNLSSVEHAVILPFVDEKFDISQVTKGCSLDDFLAFGSVAGDTPALEFEQVPFDHPLFIMYSSGTTGAPKCMVHSVGGTLIQHMKEHQLHGNTTKNDVLLYFTTTGWMMWNWMVSALSLGCALVLYDGSPLIPSPATLWNLIDELKITIFGTGAKWLAVLEEKGVKPRLTHDLSSLHTILSTGSPLRPDSYDYVYSCIKPDVLLGSISGGTDIISCFMGQNSDLPVCQGEIQGANLGMAIEVWNELGESVEDERGELVCVKPFPCMPTHFWDDDQGFKYKKAYFAKYSGVWAHGDYCVLNSKTKGFVMLGRSDGTLNPNGVRFGSAEIYNIVEGISEIKDSLCVPQRKEDGEERIVLFVKMLEGNQYDENLVKTLRTKIRLGLSARHVPAVIAEIADIPYTLSGKKVEVAVRRIINGEKVVERGAFANPDSLDLYQNLNALGNW